MNNKYSASEPGLGYIYQVRFALLKLLDLPETTSVLFEKLDDIDFCDDQGNQALASLKHKAEDETLTNLSVDFWKSINIWLDRYQEFGKISSSLRFYLVTTNVVAKKSFLEFFLPEKELSCCPEDILKIVRKSTNKVIIPIVEKLKLFNESELLDFFKRITILDGSVRIEHIPEKIIDEKMRVIPKEFRAAVFEKLEGWWFNLAINMLAGEHREIVYSQDISDKLASIYQEYTLDNLPIEFTDYHIQDCKIVNNNERLFVQQLKKIAISDKRIERAILDYYRAYEQRSSWLRNNLLGFCEIEKYEDRLIEEWDRNKDIIMDELDDESEQGLVNIGKRLYKWAETNSSERLRIRSKVSEPYVLMGSFHILADVTPAPKIYWHPRFLEGLDHILGEH